MQVASGLWLRAISSMRCFIVGDPSRTSIVRIRVRDSVPKS